MKNLFSKYVIDKEIITFGEFQLKSGRKSPYFFNFGSFNNSTMLQELGEFYADYIYKNNIQCDLIFGSAYKGIPIALATSLMLKNKYNINKEFAFNRKEAKSHGDGGNMVGALMTGKKVLAVDDVLTSGKTVLETIKIIKDNKAELSGFLVALDREENYIESTIKASTYIKTELGLPFYCMSKIEDVLEVLREKNRVDIINKIKVYLEK
ncbi:MAG: orotate phosphoribosyltransferase [Staphylococcus warneri]|uniref:orotate phosphoribosyltransferase n=1 Tax=Staphylococcus TaxID=1279 RepID=UPI00091F4181|nr:MULTISPECIES: orotate phosphoribosyltransferase [Staphylococcus]MBF2232799.1 orotate phosphoribosyltransferase [Staphylococcus epidermidis]MCF7582247.1 orotate phosphoribosyltransferase [Staphylococcus epidermidis]MCG2193590.1 orotate phosphoribosyltransferase [Staphylococcus epidermidis]MCM3483479.1 orotate phosphoribosyltransferase [Staphylococcus warneri]MCR4501859.1 orotate phosphoribosyltransferase [Staphylococcus warneri]